MCCPFLFAANGAVPLLPVCFPFAAGRSRCAAAPVGLFFAAATRSGPPRPGHCLGPSFSSLPLHAGSRRIAATFLCVLFPPCYPLMGHRREMSVSAGVVETEFSVCRSSAEDSQSSRVMSVGTGSTTSSGTCSTLSSSSSSSTETGASDLSGDDSDAIPDGVVIFSEETREHVLGLLEECYPTRHVADIIGCSERSMRLWIKHFETNGTVWCHPRLHKHHNDAAIRNTHLTRAILALVETEPAAFLRDHVDLLVALSLDHPTSDHRWVSAATVYRVLRYHGYTRKKIERLYAESSEAAQRTFAVLIDEIPMRCLVSCDETHTGGSDVLRRFGRSRRNVPCILRDRDTRTMKRTSTMMAVTLTHGVLWSQTVIVGNAQTSDDWRLFLQCLHALMNTYIPGLPWEM